MHPSSRLDPQYPPPMQIPGLNGHSTVLVGNSLVSYGGMTGPFQLAGEVYGLDLSSFEWSRLLCTGTVPAARAYHSAVMVGWRMFVYGGLLAVGVEDVHFNRHNAFAHADAVRLMNHCAAHGNSGNPDSYMREALRAKAAEEERSPTRRLIHGGQMRDALTLSKEAGELGGVLSSTLRGPAERVAALPSTRFVPECEKRWPRTQQQVEAGSLHILNMSEKECNWITIPPIGFAPLPRAHHSAAVFQGLMYLYGGYSVYGNGVLGDPDTHACATLHSLNTDTMVWRRVETASMPWPARWGCASALGPDGRWYFSSGVNPDPPPVSVRNNNNRDQRGSPTTRFTQHMMAIQEQQQQGSPGGRAAGVSVPIEVDDVYCLDLKNRKWVDFKRPEPEKTIGPRRAYLQASWNIAGRMYVHGGVTACGGEILGDVMYLDQESREWVEVPTNGKEKPTPRCGHTATVVGTEVFIVGGILNYNIVPVTMTSWQKQQQQQQQQQQYGGRDKSRLPPDAKSQVTCGLRCNDVFALNMQTLTWRKVRVHATEFLRRSVVMPSMVDEALVLDPLPPKPPYSVDEIRKPGSSEYVPPRRKLPWDLEELDVDRKQHTAMDARMPVGSAIETAVRESILDARQTEIALSRSKVREQDDDDPIVMWGEDGSKNAVASARSALTEELNLRVKRLDDFTAAASEGRAIADTLRLHFSKDVAPILRDATKWRESAALEPQKPRTDPFQDILFSFNNEVKPTQVTVDTNAMPVIADGSGLDDGPIAMVADAKARGAGPALTGGSARMGLGGGAGGNKDDEDDNNLMVLDRPWSELTPQQQMSHHAAQLHKPSIGNRTISRSIKRLGLDQQLRIIRGDAPVVEDAKEQMKNYLASRTQARAAYSARKAGKGGGQ